MNKELDRNPRKALGRGISTLLTPRGSSLSATHGAPEQPHVEDRDQLLHVPLDQLRTNEEQPRESFDGEKLQELAQSIEANGVIQPITVRKESNGTYTIIAGERRWRAARLAGLKEIPAVVRTVEQNQMLELALIENLQREDLNPVETATAFQRLAAEHGLSHEQIAERTGKDRSTITNFLRLLKLSPAVLNELIRGTVSVGHARALLNIPDSESQREACEKIVANGLSVRQTEQLVKKHNESGHSLQTTETKRLEDANVRAAIDEMARVLGTRVKLVPRSASRGRLEIEYYSKEDLDRIYGVIVGH
ncbi:MAG: ParB/RepB/Spo0J family partition protein [Acidobacteriaceae bacterium]|nr:ParB/RepB/Spo0J family partition protein [Acidobacteriaceae bacterium]MBV9780518.1 ParB/RepB/Spo0J family partition protein [Acidobacteriaceae bacterium]